MTRCPHCGNWFGGASATDSGEPHFDPGVKCPECGEFISDEELAAADQEPCRKRGRVDSEKLRRSDQDCH